MLFVPKPNQKDVYKRQERTLGNVLIMSLIAAVVLVIPTLLFLTEILTAFGASGQTLTLSLIHI